MDVGAPRFEVLGVASLPDWTLEVQAMGEATFDQVHDFGNRFIVRSEQQVRVVGHDDEGVEFVVAFGAVVLKGFEQEFGVAGDLEEAAAIGGDGRDKERAGRGGSLWDGHSGIVRGIRCVHVALWRADDGRARVPACQPRLPNEDAFTRDLGLCRDRRKRNTERRTFGRAGDISIPQVQTEGHAFTF